MPVRAAGIIEPSFGKWGSHVVFVGFLPNPWLVGAVCGGVCRASGCADSFLALFAAVGCAIHRQRGICGAGGDVGLFGIVDGGLVVVLCGTPLWATHFNVDVQDFHFAGYLCAQKRIELCQIGRGDLVAVQIHPWFVDVCAAYGRGFGHAFADIFAV